MIWNERSSPLLATVRPWKPKYSYVREPEKSTVGTLSQVGVSDPHCRQSPSRLVKAGCENHPKQIASTNSDFRPPVLTSATDGCREGLNKPARSSSQWVLPLTECHSSPKPLRQAYGRESRVRSIVARHHTLIANVWGCGGLPVFNSPEGLQPYFPRNPKTLVSRSSNNHC